MRGIGVVQDGFPFRDEDLARGAPRWWWGAARKAAYRDALAARVEAPADGTTVPGRDGRPRAGAHVATISEPFTGEHHGGPPDVPDR